MIRRLGLFSYTRFLVPVLALSALVLVACEGASESRTDPLQGLPECEPTSPPPRRLSIPGLIAPPDSVLTSAKPSGRRLTNVKGYVDLNPIEVRRFYAGLRGSPGHEFFLLEDEVFEAEAFLTDGKYRTFMRARAICATRSELFAIVAPERYGTKVKLPPRTASPSL